MTTKPAAPEQAGGRPALAVIVRPSPLRLWGIDSRERWRRTLARAGVKQVARSPAEAPASAGSVLVVRGDYVLDQALVTALADRPGVALLSEQTGRVVAVHAEGAQAAAVTAALEQDAGPAAPALAGITAMGPTQLAGAFNNPLRKREPPLLLELRDDDLAAIEKRLFDGSYKGVTDLVTKYVWPWPARHATKWCAVSGITPNQVTFVSLLLVIAAFLCFWNGWLLPGLVAAWGMTFLDTVDGKLARVTLTSSPIGNVFDHGIDLVHPPFWWYAWAVGLHAIGQPLPAETLVLAVVIGGYVLQRVEEGLFMALFGIEMHIWRRFDSRFRLVTARRNPNLLILTLATLVGAPDVGMVLVAAWTAVCFGVHALQIVQALAARRRQRIISWLAADQQPA